jgi:hypothetical protein
MPPVAEATVITASARTRQPHRRAALALGRRLGLGRHDAHEEQPEREAQQPGRREGGTPAEPLHQQPGRQRGHRDAEVARQAVDADRRAGTGRALQQHRDADRVVDRCEGADQRQCRRQLPGPLRDGGEQRRDAHAEEEHDHHRAATPQVAEPARRQRTEPEHHEGAGAEGHQVFPAREAEVVRDRRDGGREDEQEHVVHRMGHVEQEGRAACVHPGSVPQVLLDAIDTVSPGGV